MMATRISTSVEPPRADVEPGRNITLAVTIRNRAEEVAHYLLAVEGVPEGWVHISPSQVAAFPLQSVKSTVTIQVPPGESGQTRTLQLSVVNQEDGDEDRVSLPLTIHEPEERGATPGAGAMIVTVPEPETRRPADKARDEEPPAANAGTPERQGERGDVVEAGKDPGREGGQVARPRRDGAPRTAIELRVESIEDEGKDERQAPGPPVSRWRLKVQNVGRELDTFTFRVAGIPRAWFTIEPVQLALHPGERGEAHLSVHPPAHTATGRYPFEMTAFSVRNIHQSASAPLAITVPHHASFTLSVWPTEAESQGAHEFTIALASGGESNADLRLSLDARAIEGGCECSLERERVLLPARGSEEVTLRVSPRVPLAMNERKAHKLLVTAGAEGLDLPRQQVEIRLTQLGAPPPLLSVRPEEQSAEIEASYSLLIANPSAVPMTLTLSASDPPGRLSYDINPPRITVKPGSRAQVGLTVRAPTFLKGHSEQRVSFSISATPDGSIVPVTETSGSFIQVGTDPLSLDLIPDRQQAPGKATYFLRVLNRRPYPVEINLAAADDTSALAYSFEPPLLQLSPHAEGRARLVVSPYDRLVPGEARRVHSFTVQPSINGSEVAATLTGTYVQTRGIDWGRYLGRGSRITFWLAKWVVIGIILLFLLSLVSAGIEEYIVLQAPRPGATCMVKVTEGIAVIEARDRDVGRALRLIPIRLLCAPLDRGPFSNPARTIVRAISPLINPP